jgi:hypothetical protein
MMVDRTRSTTHDEHGRQVVQHEGGGAHRNKELPWQNRNRDRDLQEGIGDSGDLRNRINQSHDAHLVIESRRRDRQEQDDRHRNHENRNFDHPDRYSIRENSWLAKFKPPYINKFDGKQNPEQWLRLYSTVVQATKENNDDKVNYFPVALTDSPLQWLQ